MAKQKKTPKVTEAVARRVERAGYDQPRRGVCIICGGNWSDCPHDRLQVDIVVQSVRTARALGLELK